MYKFYLILKILSTIIVVVVVIMLVKLVVVVLLKLKTFVHVFYVFKFHALMDEIGLYYSLVINKACMKGYESGKTF